MDYLALFEKLSALYKKVAPLVAKVVARKEWLYFAAGFAAAKLLSCLVA